MALVPLPAVPKRNLAPWAEGYISSKKGSEVSYEAGPEVELWLGRKKEHAQPEWHWKKLEWINTAPPYGTVEPRMFHLARRA